MDIPKHHLSLYETQIEPKKKLKESGNIITASLSIAIKQRSAITL